MLRVLLLLVCLFLPCRPPLWSSSPSPLMPSLWTARRELTACGRDEDHGGLPLSSALGGGSGGGGCYCRLCWYCSGSAPRTRIPISPQTLFLARTHLFHSFLLLLLHFPFLLLLCVGEAAGATTVAGAAHPPQAARVPQTPPAPQTLAGLLLTTTGHRLCRWHLLKKLFRGFLVRRKSEQRGQARC